MQITPEQIEQMAREAGFDFSSGDGWIEERFDHFESKLAAYTARVIELCKAACNPPNMGFNDLVREEAWLDAIDWCVEEISALKPTGKEG